MEYTKDIEEILSLFKYRIETEHYDSHYDYLLEARAKLLKLTEVNTDMYEALKAVSVSLIDDEYYHHFKPLLDTVNKAIAKAEGK